MPVNIVHGSQKKSIARQRQSTPSHTRYEQAPSTPCHHNPPPNARSTRRRSKCPSPTLYVVSVCSVRQNGSKEKEKNSLGCHSWARSKQIHRVPQFKSCEACPSPVASDSPPRTAPDERETKASRAWIPSPTVESIQTSPPLPDTSDSNRKLLPHSSS